MITKKVMETKLSADEQLDLAKWLVQRIDNLRILASYRALVIIGADTILLTGSIFLLDKLISKNIMNRTVEKSIFLGSDSLGVIFLSISIIYAMNTSAFAWKRGRQVLHLEGVSFGRFFRPGDVVDEFKKEFNDFNKEFTSATKEQMIRYALTEYFLLTSAYQLRYKRLRWSMRFLIFSSVLLLVSIMTFLMIIFL